jgi:hypothetical protein
MMSTIKVLLLVGVVSLLGCTDNEDKASGEHVWKDQVTTIDKAKNVEATLMKSAEEKARNISEQTQ